jgi:hypothetical protein
VYSDQGDAPSSTDGGPTTADYVTAANQTKASVTENIRQKFERDTQTFARL